MKSLTLPALAAVLLAGGRARGVAAAPAPAKQAASAALPADAALRVAYETRRGAGPKAWPDVTPIGR